MSKVDMLVAVISEFDLNTVAYLGKDDGFEAALLEKLDKDISGPEGDTADVVYIDEYADQPEAVIQAVFHKAHGFLMGSKFDHDHIDVMRAVANLFNLAFVQVGPSGVWCVRR